MPVYLISKIMFKNLIKYCGLALIIVLSFPQTTTAQIRAYGVKESDNNCRTIFLVNHSSDSIYYIGKSNLQNTNDCHTYLSIETDLFLVNVTMKKEEDITSYNLLLPKDTITYKLIIPTEHENGSKQLQFFSRKTDKVINSFDEKKLNKKINKLPGRWMVVNITEKI